MKKYKLNTHIYILYVDSRRLSVILLLSSVPEIHIQHDVMMNMTEIWVSENAWLAEISML
jgi:hypothetical protein